MKNITHILPLTAVMLIFSCGENKSETEKTKAGADSTQNDKLKTVELRTLQPETFTHYVEIQGKIDANENVSINAEIPGTVSKIHVQLGDAVSVGQVLAELDAKVIQQGMAELQNALELAVTMFEKQKNLWDQKIGTELQYLAAKNQKEGLEKKMETLRQQLEMSKIKSPITGIVDAIDIKLGQATMPGLPAMRVVNMNSLKVTGEVSESYAATIKSGNEVQIIFPDMHDSINTKITYAAKVISPLNRTFTITSNLNSVKDFHPNAIAIMKIIDYSNANTFIIPVNAIQKSADGDFTFIAEGNKAKRVKVKIGKLYNGKAEILEGLKAGDKFIAKGYQELIEGEEVNY